LRVSGLYIVVCRVLELVLLGRRDRAKVRVLIHDRDTKFARAFDALLESDAIKAIRTPVRAPNANAHMERWAGTVRRECLDRLLILGRGQLEHVLRVYVTHYHRKWPHRALDLKPPDARIRSPIAAVSTPTVAVTAERHSPALIEPERRYSGCRDEGMDDLGEDPPDELAVGRLAENDPEHVQADEDVGHKLEATFRRDLAARDGPLEDLTKQSTGTFKDLRAEGSGELRIASGGGGDAADHAHHPAVDSAEVRDRLDDRVEVAAERSGVRDYERGELLPPSDQRIDDERSLGVPAAVERALARAGPRRDLLHRQPVVADLRQALERGVQDRGVTRRIKRPARLRLGLDAHLNNDTVPFRIMIDVDGISKRFGSTKALDEVSLTVGRSEVLALLGPNGAGKTTLVKILTTLLRPDVGRARVAGCDVVRDASRLRAAIGLAGQYAAVDELLTGRENLELVGLWYHLDKDDYRRRTQEALERFSLLDAADRLVKTYSGGMRRRLDIGASLIARPPVLFLDEPTTGLDPRTRNELWLFIEELVAAGTTVLLTTQYMEEAERLADRIVVIDNGRVIAAGTAEQLKEQLGGDVLEVRVSSADDLERAAVLIGELDRSTPHVDTDQRRVSIPTTGGTRLLIAAGRRLEEAGIALDDLGVRRPSLDDVFLTLTGAPPQEDVQ
jgi:ABC-2 type transport system ATP-binding protein